jgi:hypothetical protein
MNKSQVIAEVYGATAATGEMPSLLTHYVIKGRVAATRLSRKA